MTHPLRLRPPLAGMVTWLLVSLAVAAFSGFVGLLINPRGGLYGGSQHEVDIAFIIVGVSGLASVGCLVAVVVSARALTRRQPPPTR